MIAFRIVSIILVHEVLCDISTGLFGASSFVGLKNALSILVFVLLQCPKTRIKNNIISNHDRWIKLILFFLQPK